MRDLQYCLKRQWKQTETNLNQSVQIDHLARTELRWWYDTTNLIVGAPMHPPNPDIQIFTDSSMEGWGAHTLNLEVSGVWSPNERTLHINNLQLRAVVLALKHWESCHWENNTCSQRQLHRGCLYQQAGRHSIKITVHGSKRNVDLVPSEGNNSPCKIYSWKAQCSSRSVEQEGANSPHRVVPLSQDFQTVMQPVHQAHVGLVCNKIQQETGNLCISNAGPRIRSCRCPVTQLGEHVGLCISTNSPDSPDSDKDTDRGLSDHANSTRLRKGTVGLCELPHQRSHHYVHGLSAMRGWGFVVGKFFGVQ